MALGGPDHPVHDDLDPAPLLDAIDRTTMRCVDIDTSAVVDPSSLRAGIDRLEAVVSRAGVGVRDRVVVSVGNGPMFVAVLASILRLGASPLLVHADAPRAELARLARRHGARFGVTDRQGAIPANDDTVHQRFSCAPWLEGSWFATGAASPAEMLPPGVPLHPTSGTTGEQKLALRPGAHAIADAEHYLGTMDIDGTDVVLASVPMSHMYGFGFCVTVPLVSGATLASTRRFNAGVVLRALLELPATIYPASPAALNLLAREAGEDHPPFAGTITSAGSPLAEGTAKEAARRIGSIVRPLYGTTETGAVSVGGIDHDPSDSASVGAPMRGVEVDVRPSGEDEGLDEGVGQVWVRSRSVMMGYVSEAGADGSSIIDGWFATGDLGSLNGDDVLRLHGRRSELINVYGLKVLPGEVEEVISLLPEVDDVKVYAGEGESGSQIVKAAVVGHDLSIQRIRSHCKEQLAPYKRPERVVIVDGLPRTPTGKVSVAQLP
jgi:long-chain acyl-CoA synthetase